MINTSIGSLNKFKISFITFVATEDFKFLADYSITTLEICYFPFFLKQFYDFRECMVPPYVRLVVASK